MKCKLTSLRASYHSVYNYSRSERTHIKSNRLRQSSGLCFCPTYPSLWDISGKCPLCPGGHTPTNVQNDQQSARTNDTVSHPVIYRTQHHLSKCLR